MPPKIAGQIASVVQKTVPELCADRRRRAELADRARLRLLLYMVEALPTDIVMYIGSMLHDCFFNACQEWSKIFRCADAVSRAAVESWPLVPTAGLIAFPINIDHEMHALEWNRFARNHCGTWAFYIYQKWGKRAFDSYSIAGSGDRMPRAVPYIARVCKGSYGLFWLQRAKHLARVVFVAWRRSKPRVQTLPAFGCSLLEGQAARAPAFWATADELFSLLNPCPECVDRGQRQSTQLLGWHAECAVCGTHYKTLTAIEGWETTRVPFAISLELRGGVVVKARRCPVNAQDSEFSLPMYRSDVPVRTPARVQEMRRKLRELAGCEHSSASDRARYAGRLQVIDGLVERDGTHVRTPLCIALLCVPIYGNGYQAPRGYVVKPLPLAPLFKCGYSRRDLYSLKTFFHPNRLPVSFDPKDRSFELKLTIEHSFERDVFVKNFVSVKFGGVAAANAALAAALRDQTRVIHRGETVAVVQEELMNWQDQMLADWEEESDDNE